jgi:hypothetical protein
MRNNGLSLLKNEFEATKLGHAASPISEVTRRVVRSDDADRQPPGRR